MVLFQYGEYGWGCREEPSLAACNLFWRQLRDRTDAANLGAVLGTSTGVGINPVCAIRQVGDDSVGNVAVIVAGGLSALLALGLAIAAGNRQAAVGRAEMRILFLFYGLCCVFQVLDVGAFLTNGTTALTWITGIHTGFVVGVFWCLAWLGFLSLQVVEDGTLASIIPFFVGLVILVVGSAYIALDTAFGVSGYFASGDPTTLRNAWLWSLTFVWPPAAAFFYYVVSVAVVWTVLRERKPILLFTATAVVFALGQGARFALNHRICTGTDARVDGVFVAVILETLSAVLLFLSWKSITEDSWTPEDFGTEGATMTQGTYDVDRYSREEQHDPAGAYLSPHPDGFDDRDTDYGDRSSYRASYADRGPSPPMQQHQQAYLGPNAY